MVLKRSQDIGGEKKSTQTLDTREKNDFIFILLLFLKKVKLAMSEKAPEHGNFDFNGRLTCTPHGS